MKKVSIFFISLIVLISIALAAGDVVTIQDITKIRGAMDNQLFGVGVVVGLNGNGDSGPVPSELIANMLKNFGVVVAPSDLNSKNSALVMVTANIPPFYYPGMKLGVTVSSIGDAKSLQGGVLLETPLYGADGNVYAVAQGQLSIGGFNTNQSVSLQQRYSLVATIPDGAIVQKEIPSNIVKAGVVTLLLNRPDVVTAARIAQAINSKFQSNIAVASSAGAVDIQVPNAFVNNLIDFLAIVEQIQVIPNFPQEIVINERTGTVIFGGDITLPDFTMSYGNFSISIVNGQLQNGSSSSGNTLSDLVNALKALGATPQDIIAITEALHKAGILQQNVVVM
ncbi:MAG: flagellar biosynthesis protein FlgI [Mesoaciditoga sp.]|uniref:flagellar basal body P-ring protein FlgI n=1 Tax=Athalassotoga sp. TaxID=2022597 RepID=UPI000CAB7E90|nr:MAG: flagellar biosynthesis protein FlgI [Mesoaciditoga sp.]HEU24965.1 flagellar biosynthesis protein FlgI [Mesoaciditoga lauensis]